MSTTLTYKTLYDEVQSILGARWMINNNLEKETVQTAIEDEIHLMISDTGLLEGEFTGSGDGTNPYLEINESLAIVKRVHYGFTSGSDWGDILQEITPLHETGDIGSGNPTMFWLQSMHRYNHQRIYFDKIPSASVTIRVLFWKWPDDYADADIVEFKRLWAVYIKSNVISTFLSRDVKRSQEYAHYLNHAQRARKGIFQVQGYQGTGMETVFTDV